MPADWPSSLPVLHREFLGHALAILETDPRIEGVAAGGSFLGNAMDEFSDLDLLVAVDPDHCESLKPERESIAASLGTLLASFAAEHLGDDRLLICLYGPPLLHVDLKFLPLPDFAERVEDPAILWDRSGRLAEALGAGEAEYPQPDPQWIEDRFWTWVHYTTVKLGRGELFEVLDCLSFFRSLVLGPLAALAAGTRPTGVRRLEFDVPSVAPNLRNTVASYDAEQCAAALQASVDLYTLLRNQFPDVALKTAAQEAAVNYFQEIRTRLEKSSSGRSDEPR